MKEQPTKNSGSAFKVGSIALVFLIIGFQVALFVNRAAVMHIVAHRDEPDTVYIFSYPQQAEQSPQEHVSAPDPRPYAREKHSPATHSPKAEAIYAANHTRRYESFTFNPNTASQSDLESLGFSEKQASSIINYREKGGRFRRKEDFARSFVVADSVYERLKDFIDIPLLDINAADSAAFDELPGIGPWFAAKMESYRGELGGYSFPEQLMDIHNFTQEKYDALKDLICCSEPADSFALWSLPADSLRKHPYIRNYQTAKAIVLFREHTPQEKWTVGELARAGIITAETAGKLSGCRISAAER